MLLDEYVCYFFLSLFYVSNAKFAQTSAEFFKNWVKKLFPHDALTCVKASVRGDPWVCFIQIAEEWLIVASDKALFAETYQCKK